MKIALFRDPRFTALPDCTAVDLDTILQRAGLAFSYVDHAALERLSRGDTDVVVLPYLDGDFSKKALDSLVAFHAAGGSLFFLGDLPHQGRHYPYWNMRAYRFKLTRGGGFQLHFEGQTPASMAMLGELPHLDYLRARKKFRTLRVTAFPPDEAHKVFDNSHENWEDCGAVLVERRCRAFLGARMAVLGSDGGEPRESVCGAWPKPWKYDPGYLDRAWPGRDELILRMLRWCEPRSLGAAIKVGKVRRADELAPVRFLLRNLGGTPKKIASAALLCEGKPLFEVKELVLEPGEMREFVPQIAPRTFGIYHYELAVDGEVAAREVERVMCAGEKSVESAFGASLYWAFKGEVVPEFYEFVHSMIDCGAQYIRANIPWESVEPEKGVYDWRIPDAIADFAQKTGVHCKFWMFPTTRGSGLADGGVPLWTLEDAAIDRYGKRGYFPTIWGALYQKYYFAMLEAMVSRYAKHPGVAEFILDHGNSDFPYGYYAYGNNDQQIFDYSEAENKAFQRYLKEVRRLPLDEIRILWGDPSITDYDVVPTPYCEKAQAWSYYCAFRIWNNEVGFEKIGKLLDRLAPDKRPDDLPGHGLGSIADAGTAPYEVRALHYDEEMANAHELVAMHNAGRKWGGEPWQVGASFEEYDPALFQSLRCNATYFSMPGIDLGVWGDDIARCGFIRRSMAGAQRPRPEVAVIDGTAWNAFQSIAHLANRFDIEVDLLTGRNRFDFSCYKLLCLPPDDVQFSENGQGRNARYLPEDKAYYELLAASVRKGLRVLLYPRTGLHPEYACEKHYLRELLGVNDISYGERCARTVFFPDAFGGGSATGMACEVRAAASDSVLLADSEGAPLLVERKFGEGAILLAGFDALADGLDGARNYFHDLRNGDHTLARLIRALGLGSTDVDTGNLNVIKSHMTRGREEYLLLYSHLDRSVPAQIALRSSARSAFDLSTGERIALSGTDGRRVLKLELAPIRGYYFLMEK